MTNATSARKPLYTSLFAVGLFALALAGGSACDRTTEAPGAEDEAPDEGGGAGDEGRPVPVEVVVLDTGPVESHLRFSVNIEAERQVDVLARASGQVMGLAVEEGDEVRRGTRLLRIEDDEAKSQLAKVENDLELAVREHEKQTQMHGRGLVSDQALEQAAHERKRLEIALADARRALRYTRVRAPIAGTVSRRLVNLGDFIKPQQPLFEITDFDSLVARVHVPEAHMAALEVGIEARIRPQGSGAELHRGEVERIAPVIDPQSGTVMTTVAIPASEGLRPGMFVSVELVTERREDALRLPKRALIYDEEQAFAFLVVEDDDGERARRVRVDPDIDDRDFVLPASGFSPGDSVVIAGQVGLRDGARVETRPAREAGKTPREPPDDRTD